MVEWIYATIQQPLVTIYGRVILASPLPLHKDRRGGIRLQVAAVLNSN